MAYGVQILNANGDLTLDTTTVVSNSLVLGTVGINSGTTLSGGYYTGTSSAISCPGMSTTNTDVIEVWLGNNATGQAGSLNEGCIVNRGTNEFTVSFRSLTANTNISLKYYGYRF